MRRFLLSSVIVFFFAFYALYIRMQSAASLAVKPLGTISIPDSVQASTPAPTPTSQTSATPLPNNNSGLTGKRKTTPTPIPTPTPTPISTPVPTPTGIYLDGTYAGIPADAFYGTVQVSATIRNGRLTDVQFLSYPNDRSHSIEINSQAMPILRSEAIQAQNAQVDVVSGATDTSMAFVESLSAALSAAKR